MDTLDLIGLQALALEAARRAGYKVLKIYASEFGSELKGDQSPLTAADLAAHRCLKEALLPTGFPILSEEEQALPFAERSKWETYWLIDPLDGTKEFISRNGEFTVNVALVRHHEPVIGVVYVPVQDTAYYAASGTGAFKQIKEAKPEAICVRKAPAKLVIVGSRSHQTPLMQAYLAKLDAEYELISIGSSLKFCLVAEGRADLYPRLGPTSEWDTAAAQCVVVEAGGFVVDLAGKPLRYNTKDSILNPYFLAYGDDSRDWLAYVPEDLD
jgi:3'(2'), 5'-bisphosphate nucleotidase